MLRKKNLYGDGVRVRNAVIITIIRPAARSVSAGLRPPHRPSGETTAKSFTSRPVSE